METQRQPQTTEDAQWSGSASSGAAQSSGPEDGAVLELEREMSLSEFEDDRDVILMMIKEALRTRNYTEAQEIVHKYRAAIKKDDEFATLARLTSQGIEGAKKVASIQTVLDATPEDDYETRIALYERILKIQPGNEEIQTKLNECKRLRGDIIPEKTQIAASSQNAQLSPGAQAVTTIATSLFSMVKVVAIIFALLIILLILIGVFAGSPPS